MREPTDAEIAQARALRAQIILQNGHYAYQAFMAEELTAPIRIDGLCAPLNVIPKYVAFTNPALIGQHSANDVDNPTGGKPEESVFDKVNALLKEIKKPVPVETPKKRPVFTIVK